MPDALRDIILDFREADLPVGVPRRVDVTPAPGKAMVCIGPRRAGKSTFLFQQVRKLLDGGVPRDDVLYLNFFDDRMRGPPARRQSRGRLGRRCVNTRRGRAPRPGRSRSPGFADFLMRPQPLEQRFGGPPVAGGGPVDVVRPFRVFDPAALADDVVVLADD